jgi:hypothetical protein
VRPPSTAAPSLHRRYPASSVLPASPPSQTPRPISRVLPVDPYCHPRGDFPCFAWSPLLACRRPYPGRSHGIYSLVRFHSLRPSPKPGRVGPCISLFEACSAFPDVTACTLAKSPSDSLHQRLPQSRCLHCCSDCYRAERTSSRAGYSRCGPAPFHGAPGYPTNKGLACDDCSEQQPDACSQRHSGRAPKRDAYCACRYCCAAGVCSQPSQ